MALQKGMMYIIMDDEDEYVVPRPVPSEEVEKLLSEMYDEWVSAYATPEFRIFEIGKEMTAQASITWTIE